MRRIELRLVDGKPVLVSQPVDAFDQLEGYAEVRSNILVTDTGKTTLPQPKSDAYRLRVKLDAASEANEVRSQGKKMGTLR